MTAVPSDTPTGPSAGSELVRSAERAALWQDRLDRLVLGAALAAVAGVALQSWTATGGWHDLGLALAALSWLVFVVDIVIMLRLAPRPGAWVRGHRVELALVALTCPLWPLLFYDVLWLELLPAVTVLDAVKVAKLIKVGLTTRGRAKARVQGPAAMIVLAAAVIVGLHVVRH